MEVWLEAFGGGVGAGLAALADHDVPELWICETHPALRAFWKAVVESGEKLARIVERSHPSLSDFDHARDVLAAVDEGESIDQDEIAFAAFIVNRCSYSGIISPTVSPIGGRSQTGRYTVASRWNRDALASRIRRIAALSGRISVLDSCGIDAIAELEDSGFADEVFIFADPPYIGMGDRLYAHSMTADDHRRLAAALTETISPWVLTYDAHPDVLDLYAANPISEFDIRHSAGRTRIGSEYLIVSDDDLIPDANPLGRGQLHHVTSGHTTAA